MPPFLLGLSVVGFLLISVLMILIVLVQRPQGGGLSGAFGASSGGSGQTAFGAKTGDALTIATITIFVLFIVTSVAINFAVRPPEKATVEPTAASTESTGAGVIDQAATAPVTDTSATEVVEPAPGTTPGTTPEQPVQDPAPADPQP